MGTTRIYRMYDWVNRHAAIVTVALVLGIIAIRALAHKLARASYYVMKDQVDFEPEKVFG